MRSKCLFGCAVIAGVIIVVATLKTQDRHDKVHMETADWPAGKCMRYDDAGNAVPWDCTLTGNGSITTTHIPDCDEVSDTDFHCLPGGAR